MKLDSIIEAVSLILTIGIILFYGSDIRDLEDRVEVLEQSTKEVSSVD